MSDERLETIRRDVEWARENQTYAEFSGDDVEYLLDYLAALEAVRDAAVEMRAYMNFSTIASLSGSASVAEEKLREWDHALAAAGQGESKNAPQSED